MSKLYIEPFSGISGNMFMGALFDLGASFSHVAEELKKLDLGEYDLVYEKVDKLGITATHFDVNLSSEQEHTHDHENAHHQGHTHEHEHEHEHENHHHHDHAPVGNLVKAHAQVHTHAHQHRNLADILHIINSSALTAEIKQKAAEVFTALGKAEAKVHGKSLDEIHFHEVGAIDTIIDVVGNLLALEDLGITEIYVGRLQTGRGFVKCAHGLMPIPAPATTELLQGLPWYQGEMEKELVTPTGAALIHTLAKVSLNLPQDFHANKIGYGAGTWDLPIPNVVRLYLDKGEDNAAATALKIAECNLDDTTGEVCGYVVNRLLEAGALDAWFTPIYMKKNRPAYKLSALCTSAKLPQLEAIIFNETSTLGVRSYEVQRTILERKFWEVKVLEGKVKIKAAYAQGKLVNLAPEYEDCVKLAQASKLPLKEIMELALLEGKKIVHDQL